jgi:hypothetical protein
MLLTLVLQGRTLDRANCSGQARGHSRRGTCKPRRLQQPEPTRLGRSIAAILSTVGSGNSTRLLAVPAASCSPDYYDEQEGRFVTYRLGPWPPLSRVAFNPFVVLRLLVLRQLIPAVCSAVVKRSSRTMAEVDRVDPTTVRSAVSSTSSRVRATSSRRRSRARATSSSAISIRSRSCRGGRRSSS